MKKTLLLILLILLGNLSNLYAQQVTLTASASAMAENGSVTITATLSTPTSKDVVVSLESTGTASYDKDFKTNSVVEISTVAGGNGMGNGSNQLNNPTDVFVTTDGTIYVLDSSDSRIQKLTVGTTEATTVTILSFSSSKIFVDAAGSIYATNQNNQSIQKWTNATTGWITVAGGNGNGSAANQLSSSLRNFYIDGNGNIYVVDEINSRIQKWAPGATSGITVAGGNGNGSAANQLSYPHAVFVDTTGNIYVNDTNNNRVQKWSPNASTGVTVLVATNNPNGLFVDSNGSIFLLQNGSKVVKWLSGASSGITIAGSDFIGSAANQLDLPRNFMFDSKGNLYIADIANNRVQKYQYSPQIVIPAGQTSAQLIISGIVDTIDENDKTIVLQPSITNATLATTEPVSIILTDSNNPPTVSFTLSKEKITENSPTDVTLTATLSNVSGKDINIDFLMEGSATETSEYTVSSKHISIPANSLSGSITISTKGLDDTLVEMLESITFKVNTITNATTTSDSATLFLESDDNPNLSITTSKTTIAENESATITATLDSPTSKDVVVSLESTGTAIYDQDFKTGDIVTLISTAAGGNGMGNAENQLSQPMFVFVDSSGNTYVSDNGNFRIQKWAPGSTTGTTVLQLSTGIFHYLNVDALGNLYFRMNDDTVQKWAPGATSGVVIAGGNGRGNAPNQLSGVSDIALDVAGNIYIADRGNNRVQKWEPGATSGITVASGISPISIALDATGNIYVADSNNNVIQKWAPGASSGTTVAWNMSSQLSTISGVAVDSFGNIYVSFGFNGISFVGVGLKNVQKWYPGATSGIIVAGENANASAAIQLSNPFDMCVNATGNIYIADTGNNRIQKYQYSPQIVIPAGQTSAQLIISGIEDNLETEGTEQIVLKITAQNAILDSAADLNIALLDNTRTLTLKADSPFTGLDNGAVAWGDFDRDGDQDVAVMGTGNTGAVTKLYENKNGVFVDANQNFTRLYHGDISWVDINKDGWIDLVVSGFDGTLPQTKVYINNGGTGFTASAEYVLPQLYSSKMAWGDLDNDGDIDLAIYGIDKDGNYVFSVLYKNDHQNIFQMEPFNTYILGPNYQGCINGDLKMVDIDLDGDNDIVFSGEGKNGVPVGGIIYNTYVNTNSSNVLYDNQFYLKNSTIEVAKMNTLNSKVSILMSGADSNGAVQLYSSTILSGNGGAGTENQFPKLKNGDIAVADYNNDGTNDILFTGENELGTPITNLYSQDANGNYSESPIGLQGLRNSTANWVDYDMDGDLDLFLTGTGATGGVKCLLYESDIANKKNTAPAIVTGLIAEDLGNGKIKFKWDQPKDDYSKELGYVIKLGITPGGTEFSNTESNLTTGSRLITKPAPVYTNFYEMQLDPGKYYWSVQAVDTGLKGGPFSDENSFMLTYDWKIVNQGGIIDKTINGIITPEIKMGDLDKDAIYELVYANTTGIGSNILRFDGKRFIADNNSNAGNISYLNNVSNVDMGDINSDGVSDIVMNVFDSNAGKNYVHFLPNASRTGEINIGEGLFKSKIRIVDMNNDGQLDIVVLGMSTNTISGIPKLWIYEYDKILKTFKKSDASNQIAPLANASFDLGDMDKDQDIDLIISGYSVLDGFKCVIYENTTEMGGSLTLKATTHSLVAVVDGTTNFIDFDGDGDLDAVFTGTSINSDIFEIYVNRLNEGVVVWDKISSGLTPMRNSKIDLGDFNGDGYSDLLYSGVMGGSGNITKLSEYSPGTKGYLDSAFDVSDILNAEVEFGDLDGDKDLDFVIVGKNKNYILNDPLSKPFIFRTYLNVRNDSAKILASNGKKLSVKGNSFLSKTATYVINNSPSVPGLAGVPVKNLTGTSSKVGTYPIELSWLASSDDHTPSDGLTYAIKVGTTSGGEEILGANANATGARKVSGKGNVEHNKKWRLSLPVGSYYWSVQAIDASYSGSNFSVVNKFEITSQGLAAPVNTAPIAMADQINVAEGGTSTTLVGGAINVLANDTDSENNTLTAVLVSGVSNGTLTINNNGTFSYVHNGSETASDSFTYKANDGTSNSNIVTVTITISPVNDAPIATADQISVLKGGTSVVLVAGATSVLTNDTDAENISLAASLVSGVTSGTLTLNTNGTFNYVHNDSGTTSDSFTYKANDGTSDSNTVTVAITISLNTFTLPSNNFNVEVKDETCITKSSGEINITAVESYPYVATINGKIYNFVNSSLAVPNQPPGSYAICITIPGKVYEQCYTVNVAKGKTITGKLRAATNKVSVEIVEGTAPFQIFVNGKEQFETELTTFSVEVKKGDLLEVKTAKSCEGIYSKGIGDLLGVITLYPNPTSGSFEINLPTSRKEVVIDLYTAASQLISKRTYPVENERVQLNLANEPSGVYIVKIYLDTPENLTIIKN